MGAMSGWNNVKLIFNLLLDHAMAEMAGCSLSQ